MCLVVELRELASAFEEGKARHQKGQAWHSFLVTGKEERGLFLTRDVVFPLDNPPSSVNGMGAWRLFFYGTRKKAQRDRRTGAKKGQGKGASNSAPPEPVYQNQAAQAA
jgi:hypothetical protein